jgi:flagellar hook-associated protein 3 FlgL
MRITTNMTLQSQYATLRAGSAALEKAAAAASTGIRVNKASDDPAATRQIMATSNSLRSIEQYRTNVARASERISTEDSVLQQVSNLLERAKQLGISIGGTDASDQTRAIANAELEGIFRELVSIGGTKFGGEYLFGGDQATTMPFAATGNGGTLDYTTTNPSGQRAVEIAPSGRTLNVSDAGDTVFINSGVLDAVRDLSRASAPGTPTYGQAGIAAALTQLDSAFDNVQRVIGDVGARAQTLEGTLQNLDAFKANLTTFKSDLQEVDMEAALTELMTRQTAYQSALLATSKVMGNTLNDYL